MIYQNGLLSLLIVGLFTGMVWAQEMPRLPLTERTTVVLVTPEVGKKLVGEEDGFMVRTADLERQIRLASQNPVSRKEYLTTIQEYVRPWKKEEIESVSRAVATLKGKMSQWDLPFPEQVNFVRVSDQMEAGAPHCRGASVIMPDSFFGSESRMTMILAHELFHVLSSHNPELRNELYAIIGFTPCNEIELPESLQPRRLTNPDAPRLEHFIQLKVDEDKVAAVPVTLTKTDQYQGGGLFAYLDFKLMVVEDADGKWSPQMSEGRPRLLSPRDVSDYSRQIGRNTGYIIHPEETLADNFWMLVLGKTQVPDPWVLDKMREVLPKKR